jgi:hypothetical protein
MVVNSPVDNLAGDIVPPSLLLIANEMPHRRHDALELHTEVAGQHKE